MKKTIISFVFFFAVCGLFGKDAEFVLQPEVLTKIVQPGAPLKMTFKCTCPEGYVPKAWRLVAYVPNIPSNERMEFRFYYELDLEDSCG